MAARIADERLVETPHAFVVPICGFEATPELNAEMLESARTRWLLRAPRAVHFVDELPTNSAGKVVRSAARGL
jgi:acyl-coenzyme A synthetase/AMP-(fatty) acid ligase